MPPIVLYTDKAEADLAEIAEFHSQVTDRITATRIMADMFNEIEAIAQNPMLNQRVAGLGPEYRFWYLLKKKYKMYYRRLGTNAIKVLRVHSTRRKPLKPEEIIDL